MVGKLLRDFHILIIHRDWHTGTPNDYPQAEFSDILHRTWSIQVLTSAGARTHFKYPGVPHHPISNYLKVVRDGNTTPHSTLCTSIQAGYQVINNHFLPKNMICAFKRLFSKNLRKVHQMIYFEENKEVPLNMCFQKFENSSIFLKIERSYQIIYFSEN